MIGSIFMSFYHYFLIGLQDLIFAITSSPKWLYLGFMDIQLRYKRSIIGPWWVTISSGIMVGVLGSVWSKIFGLHLETYLPYFATGYIVWVWISAQLIDASLGFSQFESTIKQISQPFHIYILRLAVRHFLVLLHNFIVAILTIAFIGKGFTFYSLISIPAIILVQLIVISLSVIIAIFCTRYRDMVQVVASLIQIVFFVSPILWEPSGIHANFLFVSLNPVYHWLEIIRAPLIGRLPSSEDWIWSISSASLIGLFSLFLLGRYRSRIAYWI